MYSYIFLYSKKYKKMFGLLSHDEVAENDYVAKFTHEPNSETFPVFVNILDLSWVVKETFQTSQIENSHN